MNNYQRSNIVCKRRGAKLVAASIPFYGVDYDGAVAFGVMQTDGTESDVIATPEQQTEGNEIMEAFQSLTVETSAGTVSTAGTVVISGGGFSGVSANVYAYGSDGEVDLSDTVAISGGAVAYDFTMPREDTYTVVIANDSHPFADGMVEVVVSDG